MLRAEIRVWVEDVDDFEPRGSFILQNGRIEIEPGLPPEGVAWMREVLDECARIKAMDEDENILGYVTPTSDPEGWIRGLPLQYNGSRARAELFDE